MWENFRWFMFGAMIAGPVCFLACAILTVAKVSDSQTELAERTEWYESLMEHCVDGYYKCAKCGGPVAESLCCAWCETTTPEDK